MVSLIHHGTALRPTHTNATLDAISTNSHKLNRVDPRVMGTSACVCVCMLEQWQLILVSCLISFIIRLTAEYRGLLSLTHSFPSYLSFFPVVLMGNTWSSAPFPSTSYHIQICLIWNVNKGQPFNPFIMFYSFRLISYPPCPFHILHIVCPVSL